MNHLKSWEKGTYYHARRGKELIILATNYNSSYGDLIVAFQIGENRFTDVKNKYLNETLIKFNESSSLCGEREFENGSITYEYLYKPLGLSVENVPATGFEGWNKIYTSFFSVQKQMQDMGWVFERK